MKAATIREIKKELGTLSQKELMEHCLRMAKFKKDSKELLTYLLFEASDEAEYIQSVKKSLEVQFAEINAKNYYLIKKSVRKILRNLNKNIRYSGKKETKVELLLHFCALLLEIRPTIKRSVMLNNIFERQIVAIEKAISYLHEDLQYDFELELSNLK